MPNFTVRVELVQIEGEDEPVDYTDLHEALRQERIYETIRRPGGVRYQLPDATYNCQGQSVAEVMRRARTGAANGWRGDCRILVTQSAGARDWHNLIVDE